VKGPSGTNWRGRYPRTRHRRYADLGKQTFADNLAEFGFPQASFTHRAFGGGPIVAVLS